MLHVILLILKILGIILLSILCLILLILLAVLFVAVSYRVRIRKEEYMHVSASAAWLFRILTVNYQLDMVDGTKQDLKIRLFGIPILKPLEKKPDKPKPKKEKREKMKKEAPAVQTQAESTKSPEPEQTGPGTEKTPVEPKRPKKKDSLWRKICRLFHKMDLAAGNLKKKLQNLETAIRGFLEKKDKYLGFLNLEEHKRAEKAAFKGLAYILKKTRPRRLEGTVHFGLEDPSVTGKIYGAACVLYAWYPKKFEIIPDFEHEVMECDVRLKGKIRFHVFVYAAVKLLLNQDVRSMYKNWKQL